MMLPGTPAQRLALIFPYRHREAEPNVVVNFKPGVYDACEVSWCFSFFLLSKCRRSHTWSSPPFLVPSRRFAMRKAGDEKNLRLHPSSWMAYFEGRYYVHKLSNICLSWFRDEHYLLCRQLMRQAKVFVFEVTLTCFAGSRPTWSGHKLAGLLIKQTRRTPSFLIPFSS